MQDAITEILQLVAEGRIRPEDGRVLLDALRLGYPEEFARPSEAGTQASGPSVELNGSTTATPASAPGETVAAAGAGTERGDLTDSTESAKSSAEAGSEGSVLGAGAGSSDSEGMAGDAGPWPGSIPEDSGSSVETPSGDDLHPTLGRPPGAVTPGPGEPGAAPAIPRSGLFRPARSALPSGHAVEIPAGILLRIGPATSPAGSSISLSSIAIRGVEGQTIRVVRGGGAELTREDAVWQLTWLGGMLFLEVPARLSGLEMSGIPGSIGLSGYTGPFSAETIGGGLTVHGASAPFRVRDIRGAVHLLGLNLRDGISTITAVSQDVEIETAPEASVTVRVVSRPGGSDDDGAAVDDGGPAGSDRGGRRGVWRVGAGTAQLGVSQVRGQLRLRTAEGTAKDTP